MKLVVPLIGVAIGAVATAEVAPVMDAGTVQVVTLLLTTIGSIAIAFLTYKTAQLGKIVPKITKIEETQIRAVEKIAELEKNTNSITTHLKESAGLLGRAEGKIEGRAELSAEQAQVAKGRLEAQEETGKKGS